MGSRRGMGRTKQVLVREIQVRRGAVECPGCEQALDPHALTKHHIRPRSRGGETTLHNLVLVCRPCHDAVHRRKPDRQDRVRKAKLRRFLLERGEDVPFPPPPDPMPVEEGLRLFFLGINTRLARAALRARFISNPPFDPHWPVARALPARIGSAWPVTMA